MTVHWVLFGSRTTGSSRLHGFRIHEELVRQGYDSRMLVGPPTDVQRYDLPWHDPVPLAKSEVFQNGDQVILETVRGTRTRAFAKALRERGVTVTFSECDLYPESEIVEEVDQLICTSEYLAAAYRKKHPNVPTTVIPDAVEDLLKEEELVGRAEERPKGVKLAWIGQGAHWETLGMVREILRETEFTGYELTTVSNHPEALVPWSVENAARVLRESDGCLIPTGETSPQRAKSSNRVLQAMALGAVPLAGAIPAYEEVIEKSEAGFLCRSKEGWREALRRLRFVEVRREMVRKGWEFVSRDYTIEPIARRYVELLGLRPEKARGDVRWPWGYRGEMAADWGFWYVAQGRGGEAARWLGWTVLCEPWGRGVGTLASVAWRKLRGAMHRERVGIRK